MSEIKYSKLCSSANLITGSVTRVYCAEDHLLIATSTFGNEYYRRFFFKDICMINVCRNVLGMVCSIVAICVFVLFSLLAALSYSFSVETAWVLIVVALISLGYLSLRLWRGPTANAVITTQNSREPVVISNYFKQSVEVVGRINRVIVQQQPQIPLEEILLGLEGS
ncbi:MAG: hypothetical protein JW808_10570 [Victivallales bacterium]|nr:hypothetical protein [Victivallales bacterium]